MSQATRERQQRETRRVAVWVGLSITAHVLALLYLGVVSRSCGSVSAPERPRRFGEVELQTREEGPAGQKASPGTQTGQPARATRASARVSKGTRPTRAGVKTVQRSSTGPVAMRSRKTPPKRRTEPVPKTRPKPKVQPTVVARKPASPPRVQRGPDAHPSPRTGRSPLDMRGARPDPANTHGHRVPEWEQWKDVDPQLAAQLRYGALPRLSRITPSQAALVAAFPPDKPVPLRIVTKQLAMTAYHDGGRLVQNRTGRNVEVPPRLGRQPGAPGHVVTMRSGVQLPSGVPGTLKGLANLQIPGKGSGRVACDLYRWDPAPDARREVVLFVDTSGSMAQKIGKAQICAAGVARSALKRGYRVVVFNFSDFAYHQGATRDARKLHRILAVNIGGFTALPRILPKHLPSTAVGRDFVIVSDGLFNKYVKGSVPSHKQALRANRSNRAFFYLFGNLAQKYANHPVSVYARLKGLGYQTRTMLKVRRTRAVANKAKATR